MVLLGNGTISAFDLLLALWLRRRTDETYGRQSVSPNGPLVSVTLHGLAFAIFISYLSMVESDLDSVGKLAVIGTHPVAYWGIPEFTLAVLYLLFGFSVVVGRRAMRLLRDRSSADVPPDKTAVQSQILSSTPAGVVMRSGIFLVVSLAFFLNVNPIIPRYYLMLYPIVAAGIINLFMLEQVSRRIVFGVMFVGIGWNVLNYRGFCAIYHVSQILARYWNARPSITHSCKCTRSLLVTSSLNLI